MELKPKLSRSHTYKCLLVGDKGTGKTSFLLRHATGKYETKYSPTCGVSVHTLLFETNYRAVAFQMWDTAGDAEVGGIRNAYFLYGQCALVLFDLSAAATFANVASWVERLQEFCGRHIPIVVCGCKADLKRMSEDIDFKQQENVDYCEFSTRAAWNLEAPFKLLCTKLFQLKDVRFLSQPVMGPAKDLLLDGASLQRMWEEMEAVRAKGLKAKEIESQKLGAFA
ncbi:GTP-binding nuclear protein Ran1B-like [Scaptodrosophila lebanonensis]|uniref:GTP-binding nuclear protein Ran1B-like n=1 Tax=Drosophila lebanonensis TaxID=7225 RepID=A0A6J2THA3_DROLE|nr:GTP-binding nuclear protein Ran1B-like [Scaptodrosophila lebanonensis]